MQILLLKPNWIEITKSHGICPSNTKNLNKLRNNLYHFKIDSKVVRFKLKDYPHIAPTDWINPTTEGGAIHKNCIKKIITVKET